MMIMKRLGLLVLVTATLAACGGGTKSASEKEKEAFQPTTFCSDPENELFPQLY